MSADPHTHKEATLGDVLAHIWAARGFVSFGLVSGALCAFIFIGLAVPHGAAQVVLAPADPIGAMRLHATTSAQQAYGKPGVPVDTTPHPLNFERFEASFKGAAVARLLLRSDEIKAGLQQDIAFGFSTPQEEWSPETLAAYIEKRVQVDPVGETSLRTLRYLHPDPQFAVQFLSRLQNITDGLIRHGIRKDVNERIAYLNQALAETRNPDHRRAITDLLMEQERLKMLVSIDQPYAASVVVPAAALPKTVWPDPWLVYGGFMGVFAFLGYAVWSVLVARQELFMAGLRHAPVKQQDWFFPQSGNSNERPEQAENVRKPLTGKGKASIPPGPSKSSLGDSKTEAAE